MKHVQLDADKPMPTLPENRTPIPDDEATATVVNKLFTQIKSCKPAWAHAWGDAKAEASAKRTWVKAFAQAGISRIEQIQFGLEACRADASDFVPGPGKFIEWCTPAAERLGLPADEMAFREACRNSHPSMAGHERWTHPAVYHAAIGAGQHSLRTLAFDMARKKFENAYRVVRQRLAAGEVLSEPPLALPETIYGKGDPKKANEALAAMRAKLSGGAHP